MRKLRKQFSALAPFLMILALLALVFGNALPALALTSQDVTINATPAYVSISNAPINWTVNDVADAGSKYILKDTIYYSNPGGDIVAPSATVVDGECRFTITNTSSVAIDLTVNFPDHTGGDASTNSNTGANGATSFGAYSYFSGVLFANKVVAQNAASGVAYNALPAVTDKKWGLMYESQSNDWTSGTMMTSTVNIAATVD